MIIMDHDGIELEHWGDEDCEHGGCCDCCDGECVPDEPTCGLRREHDWTREGTGGCRQNPGVYSRGGTTYSHAERCRHCGCERVVVSHGSQRNPYQCDSIVYREEAYAPDDVDDEV